MTRRQTIAVPPEQKRATVRAAAPATPSGELVQHLTELHGGLKQLAALASEKLAALRAADAPALELCAAREGELVREVLSKEQQRNALLARLAQSLRFSLAEGAGLTEIAARLPEPLASSVRARGMALRETAAELQRKNRLVASVAHNLQAHIRGVLGDVAKAARESLVYGSAGRHEAGSPRYWVDAVG